MHAPRFLAVLVVVFGTLVPRPASAGGFYLFDRGAVAVSRGGAFVAGADDADALYYNPAGLLDARRQLQVDVALPRLTASFTRTDSVGQRMPTVHSSQTILPVPTIAYADDFGLRRWSFGAALFAPSAATASWPGSVDVGGTAQAAPQRYSLYSLNGTFIATLAAGAAFDAGKGFSFGTSLGVHLARIELDTTVSGCDGLFCTNPEDPEWDSRIRLDSGLKAAPSATFGIRYVRDVVRVGASFSTPYRFGGELALDAPIPAAPIFDGATLETGDGGPPRVRGNLQLPWIARVGVEVRPRSDLRIELDYVAEGWKSQRELRFTPQDVRIVLSGGLAEIPLEPIVVPRHMRTTHSVRLGGQYSRPHGEVRAGLAVETGAFPNRTLTVLTLDSTKTIVSAGGSVRIGDRVRIDGTFAYSFMRDRTVTDSIVRQPNATEPLGGPGPNIIGNGRYEMNAYYVGLGVRYQPPAH